jgi:hypothetical protein
MADEPVPNTREIQAFIHCELCVLEIAAGLAGTNSPKAYAQFELGWTPQGFQVWCVRHDCNVLHVDFEGCKHPANRTRRVEAERETAQA